MDDTISIAQAEDLKKSHGIELWRAGPGSMSYIIRLVKFNLKLFWRDRKEGGNALWNRREGADDLFNEVVERTINSGMPFEVWDFVSQGGGGVFSDDQRAEFQGRHNGINAWRIDHTQTTNEHFVLVNNSH